ncbi:uncharacterized protein F4807DRAFT_413085 [Annulohypoxylon truncatum]|uniref:uncharacterized protein n=1 Tax=Annulohypoxylon truncatum TaxID=327061 RepID=UPI002007451A|nr:uncharacterized protein F4807DRAFT_413085 [Annulohypoxylon truncatum]KAI1213156.1 hypothetical protein F4807DRAFT_413085 [Annulohypoxylon truncatum]
MTIKIVQVVNNTCETVRYENLQSGYSVQVKPKDPKKWENNDWIPCSDYHEDTVPTKSSGKYIRITVGDKVPFKLSDDRWTFSFVDYPDGDTREGNERRLGTFEGGEKLVLRVDGLENLDKVQVATTIYKVDESLGAGHVTASVLSSLATAVSLVLMAVFL